MLPQVDRPGAQDLAARKGKKLTCQPLPAFGGLCDRVNTPARRIALCGVVQHRGITADDSQQIVEVVCDAAGKLSDGLHSLGLAQCRFCLLSLPDLDLEAPVDIGQILRALLHYHLDTPRVSGPEQQQCPQEAGTENTDHQNSPALPAPVFCEIERGRSRLHTISPPAEYESLVIEASIGRQIAIEGLVLVEVDEPDMDHRMHRS